MSVTEVLAAVLIGGAAWGVWRLIQYPGGWSFAFAAVHQADRQDLAQARNAVSKVRGTARKEVAVAQKRHERAKQAYEERGESAVRELDRLRRTGCGALAEELGKVSLYEHVATFEGQEIPLAGLAVQFEVARSTNTTYIYLRASDGLPELAEFDGSQFPEEDVRRFSVRIEKAVAVEEKFRKQLAEAIEIAEAGLEEARADSADMDTARAELEKVTARHEDSAELRKAVGEREEAFDRWEALTGRRPR
ncbi:hypothetical protein H4W23_01150 [Streptomyces gardneri]|uniref:hypothetical protein n=1 Tax=Streptomyces gardneri TaxID=66892 RepID=UPI00126623EE|nr:hypothetical protein [Streptomyces gardneri]QPK43378.1 hypothetical protein H4W23_01150 [Streptomyces gardneri]WRK34600.1 hypothetical protein U0M97_01150 [Streptomyces venezuelae]